MKSYRGVTRFRANVVYVHSHVSKSVYRLRLQFDDHAEERYVVNATIRKMCEQIDWALDDLGACVKDGVLVFTPEQCQRFQSQRPEFYIKHEDSIQLLLEWFTPIPITYPVEAVK